MPPQIASGCHGEEHSRPYNLQTDGSGLVEQMLKYQFLGALAPELLRRGMRYEVLHGDSDLDGYDVVVEAGGVMRHIQLKGMMDGGKSRHVPVNIALRDKPSGCVVWMNYGPASLELTGWRWFGGSPGERLPDLGDRVARHSRATRGSRQLRPRIRELGATRFTRLADVASLTDRLFGPASLQILRRHLRKGIADSGEESWLAAVRAGAFCAIPPGLDWVRSVELAHLIDGYALAAQLVLGDPIDFEERQLRFATENGSWRGDAAQLWVTLFLEHRRWRFSSPVEPDPQTLRLLDRLVHQLRAVLTGEAAR